MASRGVVACGAGRYWPLHIHALLEVLPTLFADLNLALREPRDVLPEHVEEHDQVPRAPVKDPVELAPIMAPKLAQLTFDLR